MTATTLYLKLVKTSTDLLFYISEDGIEWIYMSTIAISAFVTTIDSIGIGCNNWNATYQNKSHFEWFRVTLQ